MRDWIAQFSNGWALSADMEPQYERGKIVAYKSGNAGESFGFSLHPQKKLRFHRIRRALWDMDSYDNVSVFDARYRSMNEAIRLAYEYVLEQLEEEKIALERQQAAAEVLEEARMAGKMFQMADKALQKCLVGDKK